MDIFNCDANLSFQNMTDTFSYFHQFSPIFTYVYKFLAAMILNRRPIFTSSHVDGMNQLTWEEYLSAAVDDVDVDVVDELVDNSN